MVPMPGPIGAFLVPSGSHGTTGDQSMVWDHISVTPHIAMEMGRSCADGKQTQTGGSGTR